MEEELKKNFIGTLEGFTHQIMIISQTMKNIDIMIRDFNYNEKEKTELSAIRKTLYGYYKRI